MNWLAGPPWVPAAIAFAVGAVFGRYLNRCIDRFPRNEYFGDQLRSLVAFPPAERALGRARRMGHRLPIAGWLMPGNPLRRSRREDARRAAVEFLNALLFAGLLWAEFPNGLVPIPADAFAVSGLELPTAAGGSLVLQLVRFATHLILIQALVVASVIDLDRMIIPDGSTVPAALVAVLVAGATGGTWLVPLWYEDASLAALLGLGGEFGGGYQVPPFVAEYPRLHGLLVSLAGLAVGGGVVWAVRLIGHWALGREAMGFGDVIFLAMIGSFLGWQPVLVVFFLAPVCAIVVVIFAAATGTSREFPYGPWLSVATILVLIGWQAVWPYAGRFFLMGRLIPIFAIGVLFLLAVLLRGISLLRGDERWYPSHAAEWSSGDQLHYASQENPDPSPTSWRGRHDGDWPGVASGRGKLAERMWRSPRPGGAHWRGRRGP